MKNYVQFSKKVVIAVMITVTLITIFTLVMCICNDYMIGIVDIFKTYLNFAVIVFAAYSGNSAIEKVATKYFESKSGTNEEQSQNG